MAFHWWSIPLFAGLAAGVFTAVVFATRPLSPWTRGTVRGLGLIAVAVLTVFSWWVNQGNPNWIGTTLYGYALLALACVLGIFAGLPLLIGRRHRVSD